MDVEALTARLAVDTSGFVASLGQAEAGVARFGRTWEQTQRAVQDVMRRMETATRRYQATGWEEHRQQLLNLTREYRSLMEPMLLRERLAREAGEPSIPFWQQDIGSFRAVRRAQRLLRSPITLLVGSQMGGAVGAALAGTALFGPAFGATAAGVAAITSIVSGMNDALQRASERAEKFTAALRVGAEQGRALASSLSGIGAEAGPLGQLRGIYEQAAKEQRVTIASGPVERMWRGVRRGTAMSAGLATDRYDIARLVASADIVEQVGAAQAGAQAQIIAGILKRAEQRINLLSRERQMLELEAHIARMPDTIQPPQARMAALREQQQFAVRQLELAQEIERAQMGALIRTGHATREDELHMLDVHNAQRQALFREHEAAVLAMQRETHREALAEYGAYMEARIRATTSGLARERALLQLRQQLELAGAPEWQHANIRARQQAERQALEAEHARSLRARLEELQLRHAAATGGWTPIQRAVAMERLTLSQALGGPLGAGEERYLQALQETLRAETIAEAQRQLEEYRRQWQLIRGEIDSATASLERIRALQPDLPADMQRELAAAEESVRLAGYAATVRGRISPAWAALEEMRTLHEAVAAGELTDAEATLYARRLLAGARAASGGPVVVEPYLAATGPGRYDEAQLRTLEQIERHLSRMAQDQFTLR